MGKHPILGFSSPGITESQQSLWSRECRQRGGKAWDQKGREVLGGGEGYPEEDTEREVEGRAIKTNFAHISNFALGPCPPLPTDQ